ncbi:acyl-CoA dehydrogenase family protein [Thalassobaculum sp.]|uniref:acyl-CoA dehydrogenase family protein n=1 Tax=Thalassobaculum sp. TaxID=2022740 RepID=UPI0032EFAD7D
MALDPETLNQLLDSVRRYVDERLIPLEEQVSRDDAIPDAVPAEMAEMGLYGVSIPEAYGGLGLSMVEEARLMMELGRTSPAFRSLIGTNVGIGSQGIVIDGTEEQKKSYLPRLASGELVGSFCLTEPEAGSDAASIRTSARKDGNGWILNGTKRFITNSRRAGVLTVMARSDTDAPGSSGISAFLVDARTPGISYGQPYRKMGQQGTHVADVIFEDVRVPADAVIGGVEGRGFKTAMKVLDRGRIHLSAVCVGIAQRLIEESLRYATERQQFGSRLADFQLVQAMLADSQTEMYAARSMTLDAAALYTAEGKAPMEAACCKYYASEMVGRVADRAVQIHGGAGYMADYAVERFYRDVRLFRIYEGTSQIQQIVIARNMVKAWTDAH